DGGYMSLAAMTFYSDRLCCGWDSVGISNFVTFLEHTQEYRRDLRRVEYGDERDPQMRAFLEGIPAVKRDGVTVWYLVGKDEGHGFAKKNNSDYQRAVLFEFVRRYLLGENSEA